MAIDFRRRGFADEIYGSDANPVNANAAKTIGLVNETMDVETLVDRSDLIIISIPVDSAVLVLKQVLDIFQDKGYNGKTVIDTCSTKGIISASVEGHPCRGRYVATHPMAGTEYSGPWAAMANLFDGRAAIVADAQKSDKDAVDLVEKMYDTLHMRLSAMTSESHDVHVAYVSHLSHVISFALALTVLDKEKDDSHIFDLASGGFSSTARLAKSNAAMWTPIFLQNKENVLEGVDTYIEKVKEFRDAISSGDAATLDALIREANRIKRIIK